MNLDELEALEAAGTPGPWRLGTEADFDSEFVILTESGETVIAEFPFLFEYPESTRADMALIAAARNALPSLLTQLREQRERAKTAESERDAARGWTRVVAADWRAEWESAQVEVDRHVELLRELMERTLAAERTVREQRKALATAEWWRDRLAKAHGDGLRQGWLVPPYTNDPWQRLSAYDIALMADALAALAPDTEESPATPEADQ